MANPYKQPKKEGLTLSTWTPVVMALHQGQASLGCSGPWSSRSRDCHWSCREKQLCCSWVVMSSNAHPGSLGTQQQTLRFTRKSWQRAPDRVDSNVWQGEFACPRSCPPTTAQAPRPLCVKNPLQLLCGPCAVGARWAWGPGEAARHRDPLAPLSMFPSCPQLCRVAKSASFLVHERPQVTKD